MTPDELSAVARAFAHQALDRIIAGERDPIARAALERGRGRFVAEMVAATLERRIADLEQRCAETEAGWIEPGDLH
jgi:hypothetical protein